MVLLLDIPTLYYKCHLIYMDKRFKNSPKLAVNQNRISIIYEKYLQQNEVCFFIFRFA